MKTKGKIFIVLGLLLIIAALGLTAYNVLAGLQAQRRSNEVLGPLQDLILQCQGGEHISDSELLYSDYMRVYPDMPTEEIDGYDYIGVLEIPELELSLPVMAEWDYTALQIAPCRYTGNYYGRDMVVCAHNFAHHFRPLLTISPGTDVYFTNVVGEVFHYTVTTRETVRPTAIEKMIDSEADWDLTLFTCNLGGRTRCAVRCEWVKD